MQVFYLKLIRPFIIQLMILGGAVILLSLTIIYINLKKTHFKSNIITPASYDQV